MSRVSRVVFVTLIILPSKVEVVIGFTDEYTRMVDLGLQPVTGSLLTDPKYFRVEFKVEVVECLVEKLELESLVDIVVESKTEVCLLVEDIVDLVTKAVLFLTVEVVVVSEVE